MFPSFWSVNARPVESPAWISCWSSSRRWRWPRAAAGGSPSTSAALRRCAATAGTSSQRPSRISSSSCSASATSSAHGASGLTAGDLRPSLAELAEQLGDLLDLVRVLLGGRLDQVAAAEGVDALQAAGDLPSALVVERDRELVDDRLGAAHAVLRLDAVALTHGVGGLEEEAEAAVIKHHHEAPGRSREDALLLVSGRLVAGVGGQRRRLSRLEGLDHSIDRLWSRVLEAHPSEGSDEIWLVSHACWVCDWLSAVSIAV